MAEAERLIIGDEQGGEGEKEAQLEGEARDEKTMVVAASRKEKRKDKKKMKRKQVRKETAAREREEEEKRMNDPEEQKRLKETEEEERLRMERDRKEFEEREKKLLEEMEQKRKAEEEAAARRDAEEEEEEEAKRRLLTPNEDGCDEDSNWEYVEEGPAEIIWQGNEIIVKKKRVRVPKKNADAQRKEDADRPTANPLPPELEASTLSAQEMLENVAQQVPNFGTEQDKAHCPFHLKTGACRFGQRCSRVHFYPDKACTLLIKNMYSGPGLAWEQDEGLEYTDEEVDRSYEEFYEDVHTEFLKYGEIVNFKVCRNSSSHLRGNMYVHYKSLDSSVLAYESINGRYFAGKQVTCEFVNISRWKVAICGEYMRSRLQNCSRGNSCNFIHCFRNPGGDYEWADWDKPPPRFWVQKMTALFGFSGDAESYEHKEGKIGSASSKENVNDTDRLRSRRSMSRDFGHWSDRRRDRDDYVHESTWERRHIDNGQRPIRNLDERDRRHSGSRLDSTSEEEGWSDRDMDNKEGHRRSSRSRSRSSRNHYEENRKNDSKDVISDEERKKGPRNGQPSHKRRTGTDRRKGRDREREKNSVKSPDDTIFSRRSEEVEDGDRWVDSRPHDCNDFDFQREKESRGRQHGKRRRHGGHDKEDSDGDNDDGRNDVSTKWSKQHSDREQSPTGSQSNRRRHSSRGRPEQHSSTTTYEDRWGA
ncbi:unnamed protein product [Linum trigynum]|uniref:Zinc finger CCCH domain-containing protein 5 n=1 Tax=Linum trigynum TaxID=586398 RepID=A0AAV2CB71_9ROSI